MLVNNLDISHAQAAHIKQSCSILAAQAYIIEGRFFFF